MKTSTPGTLNKKFKYQKPNIKYVKNKGFTPLEIRSKCFILTF